MPILTLSKAAKETGKSKSTLLKAIRTGRLSANRDDINNWQIDPAELFRVYWANGKSERETTSGELEGNGVEIQRILERERLLLIDQIEDLKADRDYWRNQATMLLEHNPEPVEKAQKNSNKLFNKIFRRTP
jgi:hypothetical protein